MNERIRQIRIDQGLNQDAFGKRIGIGKTSVSKIETGENSPSDQTIMLICKEFNVNERYLRNGIGEMYQTLSPFEKAYNRFGYIMENSSPSKRATLTTLLELLYSIPDDKWDLIMKQYDNVSEEKERED